MTKSVPKGEQRTDANSRLAHEQLLAKARAGVIDLYFLGDSITRRWGCSDPQWERLYEHWRRRFFGWNAGNFGWGGDRIAHMLWRIDAGELDGVNPKAVVLLAGTNDVGEGRELRTILEDYDLLMETIREKAPGATLIVTGISPRNDRPGLNETIRLINAHLAQRADGKTIRFLDLTEKMTAEDGEVLGGVTIDGLHLGVEGYEIWADGLEPILMEVLGPRAATDSAPPPTGDPSVSPGDGKMTR